MIIRIVEILLFRHPGRSYTGLTKSSGFVFSRPKTGSETGAEVSAGCAVLWDNANAHLTSSLCACLYVYVCVCVRERERERERESQFPTQRDKRNTQSPPKKNLFFCLFGSLGNTEICVLASGQLFCRLTGNWFRFPTTTKELFLAGPGSFPGSQHATLVRLVLSTAEWPQSRCSSIMNNSFKFVAHVGFCFYTFRIRWIAYSGKRGDNYFR